MNFTCFGELMVRLTPGCRGERLINADLFKFTLGGSEANVAVALASLGKHKVTFLSAFPDNYLGQRAASQLCASGVELLNLPSGSDKMGIYWVELGSGPRSSEVIYDRKDSAFGCIDIGAIKKKHLQCGWFHASGVTLGISKKSGRALFRCLSLLPPKTFVSFDLNYRKKLWHWATVKEMRKTFDAAVSQVDLVSGNESDFQDCLEARGRGESPSEIYSSIAKQLFLKYKRLKFIAVSLRQPHSATRNTWSGMFFVKSGKTFDVYSGVTLDIDAIVDRLGTGDSFLAGIIHGLNSFSRDYQRILDFAVMLSGLNHTTSGDFSFFSENEVFESLCCAANGIIRR